MLDTVTYEGIVTNKYKITHLILKKIYETSSGMFRCNFKSQQFNYTSTRTISN